MSFLVLQSFRLGREREVVFLMLHGCYYSLPLPHNAVGCMGGSRISGKGARVYKGSGGRLTYFISFFLNIIKTKYCGITETKLGVLKGVQANL